VIIGWMHIKKMNMNKFFYILLFVFFLLPFIIISGFIYPQVDEFYFAAAQSPFHEVYHNYMNWSGRYFTIFIVSFPFIYNLFIYRLLPLLVMALLFLSVRFFIKVAYPNAFQSNQFNLISFVVLSIITLFMPSIHEGYYWFPASSHYIAGPAISVFFGALLIQYYQKNTTWKLILLYCCSFALSGSNEMTVVLVNLMVWLFMLFMYIEEKRFDKKISFLFITTLFFSLVSILAPGNANRLSTIPNSRNFYYSFTEAFPFTFKYLYEFLFSDLVIVILSFILFFSFLVIIKEKKLEFKFIHPLIILLFSGACIYLFYFLQLYGRGEPPVIDRAANTIYITLILLVVFNVLNFAVYFSKEFSFKLPDLSLLKIFFSLLIFFVILQVLVKSKNLHHVYDDLKNKTALTYVKENKWRNNYLKIQTSGYDVRLPYLIAKPKTFYINDITEDPNHWINQHYLKYLKYKFSSIAISKFSTNEFESLMALPELHDTSRFVWWNKEREEVVYKIKRNLIDITNPFFIHVYPIDTATLEDAYKPHGCFIEDFYFENKFIENNKWKDYYIHIKKLPKYPIIYINTGQFTTSEFLWIVQLKNE
jgi:hypothetical protein